MFEKLDSVELFEKLNTVEARFSKENIGLACIDLFKKAETLVKGEEVELIAMVHTKIGLVYLSVFENKRRAKSCFLEAMNLSTKLPMNPYTQNWYAELKNAMEDIRKKEEALENEKWENKRKPFLDELKKEIQLLWEYQSATPRELVNFLFETFPPKHIPNAEKPPVQRIEQKTLLKLCPLYHPDKIDKEKFDAKYIVLCEEITKLINLKYGDLKMAPPV